MTELDEPAAVLAAEAKGWLTEVQQLRKAVRNPPVAAGPDALYQVLVQARGNMDRIEELLAMALSFKGAAEVKARELEQAAEDAWEDTASRERRTPRRDFEGSRERYAYWNIAIRDHVFRARRARKLADIAADTERCIALHYYGLDKARQDLARRLSALSAGWRETES